METNSWIVIITMVLSAIGTLAAAGILWNALRIFRRDADKQADIEGQWKGEVNADRKRFNEFIEKVEKEIKEIAVDVKAIREAWIEHFGRRTIGPGSPLRLTALGEAISKELDAPSWAKRIAQLSEHRPAGIDAYTIQESSFKYANEPGHYTDEENIAIRKSAYDRGLDVSEVRRVFGIELRDALLKRESLEAP